MYVHFNQSVIMWEKEKPCNHMSMYIFPFV